MQAWLGSLKSSTKEGIKRFKLEKAWNTCKCASNSRDLELTRSGEIEFQRENLGETCIRSDRSGGFRIGCETGGGSRNDETSGSRNGFTWWTGPITLGFSGCFAVFTFFINFHFLALFFGLSRIHISIKYA